MYKNQLQELAQRSCFNLPSYSCIREGPDHAPRFKATVTFNGEVFESPGYHTTLRQAEHAAAEVALSTLSRRGPTQSLAARILDETGVCKNLLQETAQRAGVSLPVYTTIRSGPKHLPLFNCMVEVGGRNFVGEPAKTKKQAEKNAALTAWSALKHLTPTSHYHLLLESSEADCRVNTSSQYSRDERSTPQTSSNPGSFAPRTRVRSVNSRDRNQAGRDGKACAGQLYPVCLPSASTDSLGHERYHSAYAANLPSAAPLGDGSYEGSQRFLYNQSSLTGPNWCQRDVGTESFAYGHNGRAFYNPQATPGSYIGSNRRQAGRHQRRHSLSGVESPMLSHEAMAINRISGGGNMLGRLTPHPQQIKGLPYQSLSERFDLNRPSLLEELQLGEDEDGWSQKDAMPSSSQLNRHPARRIPWQSQSERFEFRNHLLPQVEEVHCRDEEEWLCGDSCGSSSIVDRDTSLEPTHGYKEGWLRGETLMQSLEEQKNHGYKEGWLREEILKHSLEESMPNVVQFDECSTQNVVAWTALMAGYAQAGRHASVFESFRRMLGQGTQPNLVTFMTLATTYSGLGLMEEGETYFDSMSASFDIIQTLQHHTCMVDLFGRAGHFERAVATIKQMPTMDHLPVWSALLGACQKWGNVNVARWAHENAVHFVKESAVWLISSNDRYVTPRMQKRSGDMKEVRQMPGQWQGIAANEIMVRC